VSAPLAIAGDLSPPRIGLPDGVLQQLSQPLDPNLIAQRKGAKGRPVRYLEGHQAINQANRIFGYGRWGARVVSAPSYQDLTRTDRETGEVQSFGMYWAVVCVEVAGCAPRSEVGCGFTLDESREAHDTAIKAAVTDAMKRALRQFGDQFANALYQRGATGRSAVTPEVTDLRATALRLGAQLGLSDTTTRQQVARKAGRPFADLNAGELARVIRAMADALGRKQRAA